jgi:hypothetical protein
MQSYQSKYSPIAGTSHGEVMRAARAEFHKAQKRTPRRETYVRCRYFSKDKIFINTFWDHLKQKSPGDQLRRLKYYICGLDLVRNTANSPESIFSKSEGDYVLHRFYGLAKSGQPFCVQIKENKRTGRKDFMSVFPVSPKAK